MSENTAAPRSNPLALILGVGVLLIAMAAALLVGLRLNGDPDPSARGVMASGEASITAAPDELSFTATVTNSRSTTAQALDATSKGVSALTATLKKAGIEAADIATTNLSIDPTYSYSKNEEKITGYRASQDLRITVHKLADSGDVITKAATAAGNSIRVGDIQLSISNKADLVAQARGKAVEDSKKAAQALADAAGKEVGELLYVEEKPLTDDIPEYPYAADSMSAATAGSALRAVPISAGEQKVTVQVKVRWQLK